MLCFWNLSFWVWFLAFLRPKVVKNCGISEFCVFLGLIFWRFSGLKWQRIMAFPKFLSSRHARISFCGWAFLLGLWMGNRMSNCVPFCYWKGAKFAEKINLFWAILACFIHTLSESECFACWGRAESTLLLRSWDVRIPSLSQEKR